MSKALVPTAGPGVASLWLRAALALVLAAATPAIADTILSGAIIGTTGSLNNSGNTRDKAMDGDSTTFFDAPDPGNGDWVGLDLTGALPKRITGISYYPRAGYADRMVGGMFQGANSPDFTNAVTLFTVTTAPPDGLMSAQPISSTNSFFYVRYLSPDGGYGNVAEVAFYGHDAPPAGAPPTPLLSAVATDRQVLLSWAPGSAGALAGASGPLTYKIKRAAGNPAGPYTLLAAGISATNYTDTNVLNGGFYFYRLSASNTNGGDSADSPSATAAPSSQSLFSIYRQLWMNLSSTPGNTLDALTNTAYNPNWPTNPTASFTKVFTNLDTEVNSGLTLYGQRLRAFVVPPVSGSYVFWIASHNTSELLLSSDENPANVTPVAWVTNFTSWRQWTNELNQQSAPVSLRAGHRYYLETLMQDGFGPDNLTVRWQLPNGSFEEPLNSFSTAGTRLVPCTGLDRLPGIALQPTNLLVFEGADAVISVLASNQSSLSYQWQLNGANLAGPDSTQPLFTSPRVSRTNDEQVFTCILSNSAGSITSAPIRLAVMPDLAPPTIVKIGNTTLSNILIQFSEPVEPASATNPANYLFTDELTVYAVVLSADNLSVTLATDLLHYGSNYTVIISGVRDQAYVPNTLAPGTTVGFLALPFLPQDIGNPPVPSTDSFGGGLGMNATSGGTDIGGTADQCGFDYQLRTGDFDLSVRLAGLSLSDVWAKAGLMARETLDPSSRFAAILATPAMNGTFFESRDPSNAPAISSGNFPANYPNTWLRLKRAGNLFSGFAGYDGQSWTQLGSLTSSMPAQVYVGLALTAHSTNQLATAQFRDVADVTNALVATALNPHEPLGPSSRKSAIVISEIMYKPAPRTDGNNLEFVELYNSLPWFYDLSGFQLLCDNLSYTFPPGTIIPGGGFLLAAASPSSIQNVYGITNVIGPYTGSLKKSGTLQLLDEHGAVLLTIPYSNVPPWPVATDGTGHSLVLAKGSYGEGDPRAWDISDVVGGSPGQMDAYRPSPLRNVVINEFLAHTDAPQLDYIELYNHSASSVDISGCILTDDPATNKFVVPAGTVLGPGGFISFNQTTLNFALSAAGEAIYLKNPDQSRFLDAVSFGGQQHGVATGRWPDGADQFYPLASATPGAPNDVIRLSDIVINELMYDPISGNDDDQYIELYNRSTNTINLTGWRLEDAVSFTFPTNTILGPDSYLVVAHNAARLRTNYPNLNLTNCLGDFSGKLSHNGEHLALTMPDTLVSTNSSGTAQTNTIHITVNDVTYGTGGRWGQWSSGGGSSLELVDPHANTRLAANWADSDESQKSAWVNIETTGVLDNGGNYDPSIDTAQIGLLDVGECLVDNIEVHPNGSVTNLVLNTDFESGLTNWTLLGDHFRSSLENSGYLSAHSLHLRASDRLWSGINYAQVKLATNKMVAGQSATLRFKARWLHGWPEVLMRLHGNWLEATAAMPLPVNLGTPGARNSRFVTNAGPAIYEVSHSPSLPAAGQSVVVTARVNDPDGLQSLRLFYRLDPATNYTQLTLKDDGTGGDQIAGDGIFSATIPGQSAGALAAFYISATDSKGVQTRFPSLLNDNAPVRECLVMFGDPSPGGSFGAYHLWITQTNANRWTQLSNLSNESHDCTFVHGSRVIYNMQARFAGSPYNQVGTTPYGPLCHYKWIFQDDDKFLGATSFNKIHQTGNKPGDDLSLSREQLANTFLRALGVPWLNRRYVVVYVNGNRRGTLMEDAQTPDSDVVKENFPNDTDGWLYKMQPWFEFPPAPSGSTIAFRNNSWCTLNSYTTTGGVKKPARYRYCYEPRRTPVSDNDFTNVFSLIDAANSLGTPNYVANMENIADMENWMRVFAANHAAGNLDVFGAEHGQNLYGYIGASGTRYSLLMFDFNLVIGNFSYQPGQNIFTVDAADDPKLANVYVEPTFRRMYWRALQQLVQGPLDVANSGPLLDAKYNVFVANGLSVESPTGIKNWLTVAHDSIATQLAFENTTNFTINPVITISNNTAYVTGMAPVAIQTIWFNGAEYPITWTSVTNWVATVPLRAGTNVLTVLGLDFYGNTVSGASNQVAAVNNGSPVSPVGQLVLNEIMWNPAVSNAQYVELYNRSTNTAFDLSGFEFRGLDYTFPPGSMLGPNSFLVLAANRASFAAAYGATNRVFDTFNGILQTDGETLSLVQPGTNGAPDLVITQVRYDTTLPWPVTTPGVAAQLIDPAQDNWRAGNWSSSGIVPATPGATNSVLAALAPFPPLWINEIQSENLTGITNSAGQRVPWLELYNPGTNAVALDNVYLSTDYSALDQWPFPDGLQLNPGEFRVIFADGQTNLMATNEWHAGLVLPPGSGSVALSRLYNGQLQVADYVNYVDLPANHSFGSIPDGQSFIRQDFFFSTPGGTNNGSSGPLPVFINEWMADNTITIADPADGHYEDWFELYNAGSTPVDLGGYYLTDTITNKFQYQVPNNHHYVIPAGGYLLVWADNETKQNSTNRPDLHTNFKLDKAGEAIGLFAADGRTIDYISFGPQQSDVSMGRYPDGGPNIGIMPVPTPRTTNAAPNTAPTLTSPGNKVVYLGQTLSFTLLASDSDTPAQRLTYSLGAGAPTNAAIDSITGNFSWTPSPSQAPATNQVTFQVTDNGAPPLSATQTISITVLLPPALTVTSFDGVNFTMSWTTVAGQSYRLEYSDDLGQPSWTPVGSDQISSGGGLSLQVDMSASPQRFFRVLVVP